MKFELIPPPFGRNASVNDVTPCNPDQSSKTGQTRNLADLIRLASWRTVVLAMLLSCLPLALHAATFVQVATATPSSGTTVSVPFPSVQVAGDLNIVVVGWNDTTSSVQSVKDSAGNTYKRAVGPTSGYGLTQSIYYAPNILAGSNTVTVTFNQGASYPDIRIVEYRGAGALDAAAGSTGHSSLADSGSGSIKNSGDLIFGANTVSNLTIGAGSGFTARIINSDYDIAEDRTASSAGSANATAPLSDSGSWVMQMVAFSPTVNGAPIVSGVSPNSGPTSGGTAVTITGSGFAPGATVRFGSAAATQVTVASSTKITATSPAGTAGPVPVTVTNANGQTGSLAGCFNYSSSDGTALPAFVQVATATPESATTVTVPFTSAETAGDLNVVVVGWNDTTSSVQSVTDTAGNSYKLAVGPTAGPGLTQSIYYAPKISGGSNTVTVTFNQAASYPDIRILEYRGVGALDAAVGSGGHSSTSDSGAATLSHSGDLIFGANTVSNLTVGAGSGFKSRIITTDSDIAEDMTTTTMGTVGATAALSDSGSWVMQMAAFSPAASSPSTSVPVLNTLSCSSSSATGAASDACTVSLTGAAPSGGVSVSLSSSSGAVSVPASITIPAGATSAGFNAAVSAVTTSQTATMAAAAGGVSKTYSLQLNAAAAALTPGAVNVAFGNVTLNTAVKQAVTLKSTGTTALTISAGAVSGAGFSVSGASFPVTLNPGQSTTLTLQFDPTSAGAVTGAVTLSSNASNGSTTVISLSGAGVAAAALSGISCTNASITGAGTDLCTATLTAAAPSGGMAVALASSNTAVSVPGSVTVPAGATTAGFTATATAVSTATTDTLTATAAGVSKMFGLQLNPSKGELTLGSTSIAFGNVTLNSPSTQSITLTSTGTAAVTISAASATGTGFSLSGMSFPITLDPGKSATLDVQFDPKAEGAASGKVTLTSNASSGSTSTIALSGTGKATSYSVDLSWNAPSSTSVPVAGYDVYREVSGGSSYQMLNSSVESSTSYTDSTVKSGTSYSYYVVSVDASGNQSGPSNVFTVSVP
jgi:hypothetical protein